MRVRGWAGRSHNSAALHGTTDAIETSSPADLGKSLRGGCVVGRNESGCGSLKRRELAGSLPSWEGNDEHLGNSGQAIS